jgi:hypothetical protein
MIPSRFRQQHFDSLAHVWRDALAAYPSAVLVDPAPLAPDTFARKLREARYAKERFGWKHPFIDEAKWKELNEKIDVGFTDDGRIRLGVPKSQEAALIGKTERFDEYLIKWNNETDLSNICAFFTWCVIHPKPFFVVQNLTTDLIVKLEAAHDIAFNQLEQNKWQLI